MKEATVRRNRAHDLVAVMLPELGASVTRPEDGRPECPHLIHVTTVAALLDRSTGVVHRSWRVGGN